jgi:hypothetical protein
MKKLLNFLYSTPTYVLVILFILIAGGFLFYVDHVNRNYPSDLKLYSKQIKYLKDLKDGGSIAIPNNPAEQQRALFFLRKYHLVYWEKYHSSNPSIIDREDVQAGPKKIKLIEIDSNSINGSLNSVDVAVLNNKQAKGIGFEIISKRRSSGWKYTGDPTNPIYILADESSNFSLAFFLFAFILIVLAGTIKFRFKKLWSKPIEEVS